ncbi:MAG: hypothetical protein AAF320_00855 [Myxococcota bacterium]
MTRSAMATLQQHNTHNKSLWQMIQVRFWEKDVPDKPRKKTLPKGKKKSGFSRKDKDKLERILQDSLQNNSK